MNKYKKILITLTLIASYFTAHASVPVYVKLKTWTTRPVSQILINYQLLQTSDHGYYDLYTSNTFNSTNWQLLSGSIGTPLTASTTHFRVARIEYFYHPIARSPEHMSCDVANNDFIGIFIAEGNLRLTFSRHHVIISQYTFSEDGQEQLAETFTVNCEAAVTSW